MNPEQWKKVERLFNEAMEMEPEQRTTYLQEKCRDDEALYREVLSLIDEDDKVHDLLGKNTPAINMRSQTELQFANRLIGNILGEYTVHSLLASGGMGAVYRAHRSDGSFEQEVAIKVIHHSLTSATFIDRFRQERQILARLNHPHIARLLDGGLTDDGLPFLVMEMVQGIPINQYVSKHPLSVEEKLHLFLQICEAVNYAHSHLIVHRDLKPGNIFVDASGQVKLLDFGIAKVYESESFDANIQTLTNQETAPYTPEYAAPEQINGTEISTATDVYALGVILYELLTGVRPYEFKTRNISEIERVIFRTIPSRPSTAVLHASEESDKHPDLRHISRKLRGDLDSICLKALKKEPEQRYPNVEQFRNDMHRHLNGLPVSARGDFLTYRLKKHIQRHRIGVGLGVSFVIIIASIILFYTAKLQDQTRQAREEAAKATAVSEFLGSLFEAASPEEARGKVVTAQDILAAGAVRIERELTDAPDVQATMFNVIGDVYRRIADYDKAEQLMQKSLMHFRKLYGPESEEVFTLYANLGVLYYQTGNYEKSDSLLNLAIAGFNKDLFDPQTRADILSAKADLVFENGHIAQSDSFYRASQKFYQEAYGNEHPRLADILNARASIARHQEKYEQAESMYLQAMDLRRKLLGNDHPDIAHSLNHLGRLKYQMGQYRQAENYARQGLELRKKIFGTSNPETGASMSNLAHILSKMGRYREAAEFYRQVHAIMDDVYTDDHPYKAITAVNYGRALYWIGKYDEAESFLRSGLQQISEIMSENHSRTAGAMLALGNLFVDQGKYTEALPLLTRAHEIRMKEGSASPDDIAEIENALGFCLLKMNDVEKGKAYLLKSYDVLGKADNQKDPVVMVANRRFAEYPELF